MFPQISLGVGGANEIGNCYPFDGPFAVRSSTVRAVYVDLASEIGEAGFRWVIVIHHDGAMHNRALDQRPARRCYDADVKAFASEHESVLRSSEPRLRSFDEKTAGATPGLENGLRRTSWAT